MGRSLLCCGVLVCWFSGGAAAQSAAAPDPKVGPGTYPTSVAERPLALPNGLVEVGGSLRTFTLTGDGSDVYGTFDWLYSDLRLRVGLGATELFVDTDVILSSPDLGFDYETLDRVGGGARVTVQPNHVVEMRAAFWRPTGESKGLELDTAYLVRRQTSTSVALFGGGGLAYQKTIGDDVGDSDTFIASLRGKVGGMVQIGRALAADFDLQLTLPIADDYDGFDPETRTDVGGRLLVVTPKFDAFVGMRLTSVGSFGVRTLFAGVAGRMP